MAEHEKNIDAEIKQKHAEFDRDIEAYLNQFRSRGNGAGISPAIQQLRQRAMMARRLPQSERRLLGS